MKLCIGLCDDNPLHLRMISQEIQRLCGMREIEAEIHTWASGAQLLKEIETYDIQLYILDIIPAACEYLCLAYPKLPPHNPALIS